MEFTTIKDMTTRFRNQADKLDREKETILENRPNIGDLREDTLLDFLKRHLPKRCVPVKGGFVFDHNGNRSSQIDIIITNDSRLASDTGFLA